jgi:hypothetical protein
MGDQRIDKGALPRVAGARMDNEVGGFVDHDQRIVLIDDVERDNFPFKAGRRRWRTSST